MSLFRALNSCGILLRGRLERAMAFLDRGQVEARTSWDDCARLGSVVNRVLTGLNSFTPPCVINFIPSRPESLEHA